MSTSAERIAALEAQVEALTEALAKALPTINTSLQALAMDTQRSHDRLDAAGHAVKGLAMNLKREPFTPPPAHSERLSVKEFNDALASLRAEEKEHGGTQTFFPVAMIQRRTASLRSGTYDATQM